MDLSSASRDLLALLRQTEFDVKAPVYNGHTNLQERSGHSAVLDGSLHDTESGPSNGVSALLEALNMSTVGSIQNSPHPTTAVSTTGPPQSPFAHEGVGGGNGRAEQLSQNAPHEAATIVSGSDFLLGMLNLSNKTPNMPDDRSGSSDNSSVVSPRSKAVANASDVHRANGPILAECSSPSPTNSQHSTNTLRRPGTLHEREDAKNSPRSTSWSPKPATAPRATSAGQFTQKDCSIAKGDSDFSQASHMPVRPDVPSLLDRLDEQQTSVQPANDPGLVEIQTSVPNTTQIIRAPLPESIILERIPVSRFSSSPNNSRGKQIAVNGLIAYSTRAGRIRIIDPISGARLIRKAHAGLAHDISISCAVMTPNGPVRRLASCFENSLAVWEVPAAFDSDGASNRVQYSINLEKGNTFARVRFHPHNASLLLCQLQNDSKIYLVDLRYVPGNIEAADAAKLLQSCEAVCLKMTVISSTFSQDGSFVIAMSAQGQIVLYNILTDEAREFWLETTFDSHQLGEIEAISTDASQTISGIAITSIDKNSMFLTIYGLGDTQQPLATVELPMLRQTFSDDPLSSSLSSMTTSNQSTSLLVRSTGGDIHLIRFHLPSPGSQKATPLIHWLQSLATPEQPSTRTASTGATGALAMIHMWELPLQQQTLQFVYHEFHGRASIFFLHPEGFEQIVLDIASILPTEGTVTESIKAFSPSSMREPVVEDALLEEQLADYEVPEVVPESVIPSRQERDRVEDPAPSAIQRDAKEGALLASPTCESGQSSSLQQLGHWEKTIMDRLSHHMETLCTDPSNISKKLDVLQMTFDTDFRAQSDPSVRRNNAITAARSVEKQLQPIHQQFLSLFEKQEQQLKELRNEMLLQRATQDAALVEFRNMLQDVQSGLVHMQEQMQRHFHHASVSSDIVDVAGTPTQEPAILDELDSQRSVANKMAQPSEECPISYEDLFLHALQFQIDPLKSLVDEAPDSRWNEVFPHNKRPLISATTCLTLLVLLATAFDNGSSTLKAGNGYVRLRWINACLQATYWARLDTEVQPYVNQAFQKVMQSLHRRLEKLQQNGDIEKVEESLYLADTRARLA